MDLWELGRQTSDSETQRSLWLSVETPSFGGCGKAELRSVSGYVGRAIVEALASTKARR